MLNDKVIRFSAAECVLKVVEPLMGEILVYRIHNSYLFIYDSI